MSHPIFGRRRIFFFFSLCFFLLCSTGVFAALHEFTYDHMQSMVPATSIGPDFVSVSMLQFRLKATSNNITIASIEIGSGDGTPSMSGVYAPSTAVKDDYVYHIDIYCDKAGSDNEHYDEGVDPLVGSLDLGNGNTQYSAVVPVSGAEMSLTSGNAKAFFVFYSTGSGMTPGTVVRAQLRDATISESDYAFKGTLPAVLEPSFVLATVNVYLDSIVGAVPTIPPSFFGLGGEKDIPIFTFTLRTTEPLSNVSINIRNNGMSFINSGCGVEKIRIKRKNPDSSVTVVGYTATFVDSRYAVVPVQSIPLDTGGSYVYTVYYDMSPGTLANTKVEGQLSNITGTNVVFNTAVLPAPSIAPSFYVTPAPITVVMVTTSTQVVNAGTQFMARIVLRHTGSVVGFPNWLLINEVRPMFYSGRIAGADISYEYTYQFSSWQRSDGGSSTTVPSADLTSGQQITFNYLVTVSNPRTTGMIGVDAWVNYRDGLYIAQKSQEIIMSRYLKSSSYVSAAQSSGYFMNMSSDDSQDFSLRLPSYIVSMNVQPYGVGGLKRFMNGDIIAQNSRLLVTLIQEGKFYDSDTLKVYLNDILLTLDTDYTVANGIITVNDLGTESGVIKISCASGPTLLETATIRYYLEKNFKLKDFMAGPSPYKPSEGSLYFSCQLPEPASVKLSVYDSAGQLIWRSDSLEWVQGYNEFAWDGKLDVGGDIGRGTYVVYIVAKCSRTDSEKTQKIKFSVF